MDAQKAQLEAADAAWKEEKYNKLAELGTYQVEIEEEKKILEEGVEARLTAQLAKKV